jgi:hypothetical protein
MSKSKRSRHCGCGVLGTGWYGRTRGLRFWALVSGTARAGRRFGGLF